MDVGQRYFEVQHMENPKQAAINLIWKGSKVFIKKDAGQMSGDKIVWNG